MADGDFSSEEGARKYDEEGAAVKLDVTSSEDEDEDPDQLGDADQDEEKGRSLMQDFMQEELAKQLIQQDLQLSFGMPTIQTSGKTLEEKINLATKANTANDLSASLMKQQAQARSFLVAQLVDLNEGQTASDLEHHQRSRLFKNHSDQDGSLLAKLMQDRNHHAGGQSAARLDLVDEPDEACKRRVSSSSSLSQMDDLQQLHSRQGLEAGGAEQRSRSTSGHSFGDDQLKGRSIDLDEHVKLVNLFGVQIVALTINGKERLCLAQISNTLLKEFSYNEIHNRRVALGITCVQCTPIQLEMLRRAGAMPSSSRRCGMITMREAERLCKSFLAEEQPPELPENFYFTVAHRVNYGCRGRFVPARYISSRAKCIECFACGDFFSPNKFIFHSHKDTATTDCNPPDSPNINSWRKHINLDWSHEHSQEIKYAWEDVKSLFNGGTRRRTTLSGVLSSGDHHQTGLRVESSPDESGAGQKSADNALDSKGLLCPRGSTIRTAKHNQQQNTQQATASEGPNVETMIEETRRGEQTRTPRAHTLSQNERRKLPIGVWSRDRQKQQVGERQVQASFRRSPSRSYDNLGHQQHVVKRVALNSDWQQQNKLAACKTSATGQQVVVPALIERQQQASSSLYQPDHSFHLDPMRTQQHIATASLPGLGDFKSSPISAHNQAARLAPTDLLAEQGKANVDSSTAGTFLYSQLYSQLMQSQLAHQVDHRSHQQHQMASIEAQMALRQQIWSSLLANLRPQSRAPLEQPQIGGQIFKANQMVDYCLTSSEDQRQTSSLLAAAAAAAAAASNSITSPSSNSFGGHHQALAHQQGSIMEMNQLRNLALKVPNTSGNSMQLYATSSQANTSDATAIFNGGSANC